MVLDKPVKALEEVPKLKWKNSSLESSVSQRFSSEYHGFLQEMRDVTAMDPVGVIDFFEKYFPTSYGPGSSNPVRSMSSKDAYNIFAKIRMETYQDIRASD